MQRHAVVLGICIGLLGCSTSGEGQTGGGESLGAGPHPATGSGGRTTGTSTATGEAGGVATASGSGGAGPGASGATGVSVASSASATSVASSGSGPASASASTGTTGPATLPFGGSSGGSGGPAPVGGTTMTAGGVTYDLIVPSSYSGSPTPFLLVYSGTEGASVMTMNLQAVGPSTGTSGYIEAVIDGVTYNGDGAAGATVLDAVRAAYDIDNDRIYLLGESAGTTAALALGLHIRNEYFAAYWANDVNATDTPGATAAELGFAPWGQAGPGGDLPDADAIVAAMQTAGYRLPSPAPYAGAGSTTHGDPNQFIAAISFFVGKSRQ